MTKNNNLIKYMTVLFALSVGVYRLSRAVSGIMQAIATMIGLYLLFKNRSKLRIKPLLYNYYKVYGFFILGLVPSLFVSTNFNESIRFFIEYPVYQFMMFVFITMFETDLTRLRFAMAVPLISGMLDAITMIYQSQVLGHYRPGGIAANPLHSASIIFIMLIVSIAVSIDSKSFGKRLNCLARVCLLPYIGAYVLGHHRSLWICTPIPALASMGRFLFTSKKVLITVVCCALLAGGYITTHQDYMKRIQSITQVENYSTKVRINIWNSAYNMYKDYPVAGVGLEQFQVYYVDYGYWGKREKEENRTYSHAHNSFMATAAEAGTCGLVGFIVFCMGFTIVPLRAWFKTKSTFDALLFAISFGFLILLGMFDPTFYEHKAAVRYFWLVLSVVLCMKQIYEHQEVGL